MKIATLVAGVVAGVLFGGVLPAEELDLSTRTDADAAFDIAFCARPSPGDKGKPGHAFVAFSRKPHDGERDFLAIGHTVSASETAASSAWSYFGSPVSGLLKEELYTSVEQNCLVVTVNSEDYEAARQLADAPLHQMGIVEQDTPVFQAYRLGEEDCMTFMISVAETLTPRGLQVPARQSTELPMDYMQRFIGAN